MALSSSGLVRVEDVRFFDRETVIRIHMRLLKKTFFEKIKKD
jgi:hypothetical protein